MTLKTRFTSRQIALVVVSLVLLTDHVVLAQSRLYSLFPFALKRGETVDVTFYGERLTGAYPVVSYTPGLTHSEWEISEDAKRAKTTVTIAEDFPLGWHALRMCGPNGWTDLRTFYVSDAAPTAESPKPHGPDQPQEIDHESLLVGRLQRDNHVDWYSIELQQGDLLSAEVQALRAGRAMLDVALEVIGPDGNTLAECDDTNTTQQDPYVRLVAPQAGVYRLAVRETRFTGNGNYWYLLHTGRFPRPAMPQQLGGRPNTNSDITWLNADGTSFTQNITFPAATTPELRVFPADEQGMAPTPHTLRVNELSIYSSAEPNDSVQAAHEISVPTAVHGVIDKPRDHDFFRFDVKKGQVVEVRTYARNPGRSPLDAIMNVKRIDGTFLASNDDLNGKTDSGMRITATEDATLVVMIRDQRYRGGPEYAYRLEFDAPRPQLKLSVPDVVRNQSAVLSVSRNNRMAALVTVERRDVAGAVSLLVPDLPAALSIEHRALPAGRYRVPVLFTAAADAEPGGYLMPIHANLQRDDNTTLQGRLSLRQRLVTGRNNREMWAISVDKLATAIVPESPLSIELIQPHVPLVRSGRMDLKIVAKRSQGFTAAARVRMLYNPTGVSSRDVATIAENATETSLALTANAQAAIGDWPIVIVGVAQHEGRYFQVSTQLGSLSIAEHFFELQFPQASIERGASGGFHIGVNYKTEFSETANAQLVGLPAGVTAEPIEFHHGDESLSFKLVAASDARIGHHGGITCRITIQRDGEPITHVLGTGRLRVDQPLSKKVARQ